MAERCAAIIRREAGVDIPADLVAATAKQSTVTFGIKEAYIYRDWQVAIGDMMLREDKRGARHFSVLGFGVFEDLVLEGRKDTQSHVARWIGRPERLIHDLDVTQIGMFDARREQMRNIYGYAARTRGRARAAYPRHERVVGLAMQNVSAT